MSMFILASCGDADNADILSDLEVINVQTDKLLYHNLQEVEDASTIIIDAIAKDTLDQKVSTHYNSELNKELPGAGYTRREIEVTKVYKGNVKVGDKLVLLQGYYIWTNADGEEQLISMTSLKPAIKDKEYMMFLEYYEPHEGYWPVGDYEGMFPIPTDEMKKKAEDETLEQTDMDVYSGETLHYLIPIYSEMVEKYFRSK